MNLKTALSRGLTATTKTWKSEMHKADRHDRISYGRFYQPSCRRTIKDAVYRHIKEAYNRASSDGKYWANARQIFYALRPMIQNEVDADDIKQPYITGVLLKDILERDFAGSQMWKVAWDARGHFEEPHTGKKVGVGGIEVTEYLDKWRSPDWGLFADWEAERRVHTDGPEERYSSVLFIEKEGFNELLQAEKIGDEFDMAIMSTKGMPVKAACDLLYALPHDVRIFALHDFDKSGFTILKTLREGTRLAKGSEVIDLGLRLGDVADLESEEVNENTSGYAARRHLERCGATEEEIEFLIPEAECDTERWAGQRVELNAMMSDQFIGWLRGKLKENGAAKVVPDEMTLALAYRRALTGLKIEEFSKAQKAEEKDYKVPDDLAGKVEEKLDDDPTQSWDEAVREIAEEEEEDENPNVPAT